MVSFNFLLFVVIPYIAVCAFVLGMILKLGKYIKMIYSKSSELSENNSFYLLSSTLGIIIIHVVGYFLVKILFVLTNISYDTLNNINKMIQGILMIILLSVVTYLYFRKKIKQKYYVHGNFVNMLIAVIIFIHIVVGYAGIMLVDSPLDNSLKREYLGLYMNALWDFDISSYVHLKDLNFTVKTHLILGFSLLAFLPFTNILDIILQPIGKKLQSLFHKI